MLHHLADFGRRQPLLRAGVLMARRWHAGAVDRALNIRTVPHCVNPRAGLQACVDAYPYEPIDYPLAWRCMRTLGLREHDVVYDLGCGMGRIVCLAARHVVRRCVGVEISGVFARAARGNAQSLRGRLSPIDILQADAAEVDYRDGTVFFLFNPFGEHTLRQVLRRLRQSLQEHPREIRIGYGHPMHEDLLLECGWLERYDVNHSHFHARPSSFWRTMPARCSGERVMLEGRCVSPRRSTRTGRGVQSAGAL